MILTYDDLSPEQTIDCDVVVIGTGAGGAAAGATLAEAGYDVVFVEEGSHHPTTSFNPYVTESIPRLYRDASATVIFGKPPIPYVEGRCVGGSTVINGGMAYRPPDRVLDAWGRIAPALSGESLEPWFAAAERSVSAELQSEESVGEDSRIMAAGARSMGWHYTVNRRNQRACVGANNCALGCPTGAKQSALVSYLPRAFAKGARCLTEVRVERLLVERGRAVGVRGVGIHPVTRRADRPVVVRARAVIVACGAVQTPLLMLAHRLGRPSGQLGRNFLCHPNAKVLAVYPDERDVRGWQGVSQNTQIREFHEDGILFAENFVAPGILGAYLPFHGTEAWELMLRYNHLVTSGVLVEDSGSGRVSRTLLGTPLVRYDVTAQDHRRFLRGVKLLAEMHFAMGAEKVLLPFFDQHVAQSVDDLASIDARQTDPRTLELFTVHLMGTARMGADPTTSVVNLDGEVWDLPGAFVADASVFPTAIGVNPQITIMALASKIGAALGERLVRRAA